MPGTRAWVIGGNDSLEASMSWYRWERHSWEKQVLPELKRIYVKILVERDSEIGKKVCDIHGVSKTAKTLWEDAWRSPDWIEDKFEYEVVSSYAALSKFR